MGGRLRLRSLGEGGHEGDGAGDEDLASKADQETLDLGGSVPATLQGAAVGEASTAWRITTPTPSSTTKLLAPSPARRSATATPSAKPGRTSNRPQVAAGRLSDAAATHSSAAPRTGAGKPAVSPGRSSLPRALRLPHAQPLGRHLHLLSRCRRCSRTWVERRLRARCIQIHSSRCQSRDGFSCTPRRPRTSTALSAPRREAGARS